MCWQRKMCHWHRHVEFEDKIVDVSNWSQTVLEISFYEYMKTQKLTAGDEKYKSAQGILEP